ncbi:efflux RND transporter permease subunit, partial [Glaciimonas sp. GG7]
MLNRIIQTLEGWLFSRRLLVLGALALLTAVMAYFALQLRMDAGFEKQIPIGHEYVKTFQQYRADLFGANRLTVVVKAKHGTIWTKEGLTRLYKVTQATAYLPNVDRLGVQSLWTPNSFVNEITEEGFRSQPIIPGTITPEGLSDADIAQIKQSTAQGGFVGSLVSRDQTGAMITAEIGETDTAGKKIDYVQYNRLLEDKIRKPFEDADYDVQIIGFAKQIGDIADGAKSVLVFCAIALVLTALSVYWYCHSLRFTILPIVCSLTSLVWQFGTLRLLGFGLDPLGVLVPFLVFAIGVSHGVQQINFITRELAHGKSSMEAARHSFTGLLIPGTLALVTALVSFVTLLLIPIPMIRELAITASLGVGYKILTNLVMLPVAASCFNFTKAYADKAMRKREQRARWLRTLARVAEPRNAV